MHAYDKMGWTLKDFLKYFEVPTQRRCGEILGLSKLLVLNRIHHKCQVLIIVTIFLFLLQFLVNEPTSAGWKEAVVL